MNQKKLLGLTAALSLAMTIPTFAAGWQKSDNGWQYDNGTGVKLSGTWQWIDGNGDGIAENYYFDENGYCMINTTTPDGHTTNESGAWTQNGQVQTQQVNAEASPDNGGYTKNVSNTLWDLMNHTKKENEEKYGKLSLINGAWRYAGLPYEVNYLVDSYYTELEPYNKPYTLNVNSKDISLKEVLKDAPNPEECASVEDIAVKLENAGYQVSREGYEAFISNCRIQVDGLTMAFNRGQDGQIYMLIRQELDQKVYDHMSSRIGSSTSSGSR